MAGFNRRVFAYMELEILPNFRAFPETETDGPERGIDRKPSRCRAISGPHNRVSASLCVIIAKPLEPVASVRVPAARAPDNRFIRVKKRQQPLGAKDSCTLLQPPFTHRGLNPRVTGSLLKRNVSLPSLCHFRSGYNNNIAFDTKFLQKSFGGALALAALEVNQTLLKYFNSHHRTDRHRRY
jgi:hypothetical protein